MCDTCGCGDTDLVPVEIQQNLLARNDHQAAHNRAHFVQHDVLAINLMGSPGSGKTALLEATAKARADKRLQAVSGDLATENDSDRLNAAGIPSRPITTGTACHLDADLVHHALHDIALADTDWFFIENVGNLVCPAIYDLGQAANVVALSITEGEDKPLKYPVMFQKADLVVITKVDLLPYLDFDMDALEDALARVMPDPKVLKVSARTGEGLEAWVGWLEEKAKGLTRVRPEHLAGFEPVEEHGHGHAHPHSH